MMMLTTSPHGQKNPFFSPLTERADQPGVTVPISPPALPAPPGLRPITLPQDEISAIASVRWVGRRLTEERLSGRRGDGRGDLRLGLGV